MSHRIYKNIKLFKKFTFNELTKYIYGFNTYYKNSFTKRYEMLPESVVTEKYSYVWRSFLVSFSKKFPKLIDVETKLKLNLFLLDILQTYKGWRHIKGLPVRGQRTWTNGKSVYRSNLTLRKFKIKLAQKVYSQLSINDVNTVYLAEQINSMWKTQWEAEWKAAKKNRLRLVRQGGIVKADLAGMAKNNVVSPQKLQKMNKKQRQALKKNNFSLGFDSGFTKKIIEDMYKSKFVEQSKNKNKSSSLSLTEKKYKPKVKKKKIDTRTLKIKHNLKKKSKKSVWD